MALARARTGSPPGSVQSQRLEAALCEESSKVGINWTADNPAATPNAARTVTGSHQFRCRIASTAARYAVVPYAIRVTEAKPARKVIARATASTANRFGVNPSANCTTPSHANGIHAAADTAPRCSGCETKKQPN